MSAAFATMRSLALPFVVGAALLSTPVHAAEPPAIPRIGVLNSPMEELLRKGLREHGYEEGKNIIIEWPRYIGNDQELRSRAADLVRSKVDVIVTFGSPATRAALAATTTIPVVFSAGDPVTTGLVASLAKPGANGTGVSVLAVELAAKRLEFLHQLAPRARRIVYLMNPSNPIGPLQLEEVKKATRMFGLHLIALDARNEAELDTALRALPAVRLMASSSPPTFSFKPTSPRSRGRSAKPDCLGCSLTRNTWMPER